MFIIFNRPDLTARVFTEISRARPRTLLVIADGPPAARPGEAENCAASRAIIDRVDWDCNVLNNYAEVNMGCGRRVATGLRWVFEQVEEAIILEDDCLPHPTFFRFCEELLDKYRHDERVMHISGAHIVSGRKNTPFSYSFSRYPLSWGWASWRRAFQHYDPAITLWPSLRDTSWLVDLLGDPKAVEHWKRVYDSTHSGMDKVNTWDFQWLFACWAQFGLSILSNINLVSNIGFREDATHTRRSTDKRANLDVAEMTFPLNHPPCIVHDREYDQMIFDQTVRSRPSSLSQRLRRRCVAALPTALRKPLAALRSIRISP